jgi:hypothetical protein
MRTPPSNYDPMRSANVAGVAHRQRGLRHLRKATILTVASAALVTVIGTSLASQPATHHSSRTSGSGGGVASSAAAVAAAQQAASNQASASSGNASASASTPQSTPNTPVASSGGS